MLLENKNAIAYGEGGAIGGAVARVCSDGLQVKPGIRPRTGRDLEHCTGTIRSNETE
jgi:hypothetical protein